MKDDGGTQGGDTGGEDRPGGVGPSNTTEESPDSESELALDRQAAKRESDSGKDDE